MAKCAFVCLMLSFIFAVFLISPAMSQQEEFLVGYWSFDEEGDVVEDQSGKGNNGVINGEVKWVDGKMNKALEFTPGANIQIPDSDTLRDMDEYTIAMWVKLNEFAPAWNHLFEKDGSYGITMNTGGGDFRYTPNSSKVWIETKKKIELDTWYYLTMKWNGSEVSFYIDGVEEGKSDEPVAFNANPINIAHSDPYTVEGVIDEVKFWAKALTVDEIKVAMMGNAAVAPLCGKLVTTWAYIRSK